MGRSRSRNGRGDHTVIRGAPPSGNVVFLFSDIEGSTQRWETHRDAMQEALRRHDSIMASAIETHDGYIFKTVGDAYCAAFRCARDAAAAALQAQRRFATEDWSSIGGLHVRMAMHAGETDERSGDYFGPAVNRVARLLSCGHGGQVLLSAAARDLLGADAPGRASLRSLGTFRLKDLQQPESVFQLIASGLESDFKPLRSLEAVPNNLPRQSTGFIGREEDLERVERLIRQFQLVTIAGTGGVGKTRIALQASANLLGNMEGGAWFVNLAPLSDPALVAGTVLSVFGIAQQLDRPALELVVEHLKDRHALIIIDNCEHLILATATVCEAILTSCPRVTLLVTSREALNIAGEHVYRLPALDTGTSVRLFIERACAVDSNFQRTDSNVRTIEEICRRLDGIALAIELAAARIRVLSPDQLLEHLGERLRWLTGGSRSALPRQQTMRAMIDWSYEILSEEEKALFRRAGVFSGGFLLPAAAAVCADDTMDECTLLDLLSRLVDKSLLVVDTDDPSRRFRFLQSIHEYARERLVQAAEAPALRERLAGFFAAAARRAYEAFETAPGNDAFTELRHDLDNVRIALTWSIDDAHDPVLGAQITSDLVPLFLRMSLLREAVEWCRKALNAAGELPSALSARLYYGLSMLYNNQGRLSEAMAAIAEAVPLYRSTQDARGLTHALAQLAQLHRKQNHDEQARSAADEALERARTADDDRLLGVTLRRCAFALKPHEIEQARAQFEQSAAIFRGCQDKPELSRSLSWWAISESNAGCFERAIALSTEALEHAEPEATMFMLSNIAGYALKSDNRELALQSVHESLRMTTKARSAIVLAMNMLHLSALVRETDLRQAARFLGCAQRRFSQLGWSLEGEDRGLSESLHAHFSSQFEASDLAALLAEGATWTEDDALEQGLRV